MCLACNPGLANVMRSLTSRRDVLRGVGAFAATAVAPHAAGFARAQSAAARGPAEIIFQNGSVLTMNDMAMRAESLAVRGGRIVAVGTNATVTGLRGANTRIVDLAGRALLPGFIDPHMHFAMIALDDFMDVGPTVAPSMDGLFGVIKTAVQKSRPGAWIRAQLFDTSVTKGGRAPSLAELDALAPDNPLFMLEANGHVAYVNSRAFRDAGVTRDSKDPPTSRYLRDSNGDLTGQIEEVPAYGAFLAKMPQPTSDDMVGRILSLAKKAAAVGCTGLHDCGIGALAGAGDLALLQAAMAKAPPVRVRGMLVSTEMATWERMGLKPGFGDDRFQVDGIKTWSDGSNQARTGYQRAPYLGGTGRGALNYTLEALTDAIRQAHKQGWQVGVHSNGDAGIDTTLQAFQTVLRETPRADHRHRIEHCSILRPEHIAKMAELGISPSFLIGHVSVWGKAFRDRLLGRERADLLDPCASALKAGLRISVHSDYNVTQIEPLRMVQDAATRVMNEGGEVLNADERIPVLAALRAVTLDAAWQCRMDNITGSLEVGKYADLAILERDPTTVDAAAIKAIKVSETWLGGVKQ